MRQPTNGFSHFFGMLIFPLLFGSGIGMIIGTMYSALQDYQLTYYWTFASLGAGLFLIIHLVRKQQGATLTEQQKIMLPFSLVVTFLAIPVVLNVAAGAPNDGEALRLMLTENAHLRWALTLQPLIFGIAAGFVGEKKQTTTSR